MRRFSQRNSLVTLNEINITPLLDLAFVLLIIFVITTPALQGNLDLKLPHGKSDKPSIRRDQVRIVEVDPAGGYMVNRQRYSAEQLQQYLAGEVSRDPNVAVRVRADRKEEWNNVYEVLEMCGALKIKLDVANSLQR
jgi:biopolymer transport protein ExbD